MTRLRILSAVALCTATLAAFPAGALAADAAPGGHATASPDQPRPRTGRYRIVSRGATVIHAKCLEGGNVVVPTRQKAPAAERDRAIHDACKTVDYSK
jgi:hypothetical protein